MMTKHIRNDSFAGGNMIESTTLLSKTINVILAFLLFVVAFCCFIPLWHVLMASLSDGKILLTHVGILWSPAGKLNFDGYKLLFSNANVMMGYVNTIIYVVGGTSFGAVLNALGGYVLSRIPSCARI